MGSGCCLWGAGPWGQGAARGVLDVSRCPYATRLRGQGDACQEQGLVAGCGWWGAPGAAPAHWCRVPTSSPLSFKDITTLELSCMAEYGGPVFPYIALGGYPGEWVGAVGWDGVRRGAAGCSGVPWVPCRAADSEYTQAEALIVTYSLNNFPRSDPRHKWVLSWEQRFLEVVRDFQRNHSQNLSVSFMAEVRHVAGGVGGTQGCLGAPAHLPRARSARWRMRSTAPRARTSPSSPSATWWSSPTSPWRWASTQPGAACW